VIGVRDDAVEHDLPVRRARRQGHQDEQHAQRGHAEIAVVPHRPVGRGGVMGS
jgi:hypothetical protein